MNIVIIGDQHKDITNLKNILNYCYNNDLADVFIQVGDLGLTGDFEEFLDELEEVLIMSDIGVETSVKIISNLRNRIKKDKIQDEEDVKKALREEMKKILDNGNDDK